jgi:hypothetical protein
MSCNWELHMALSFFWQKPRIPFRVSHAGFLSSIVFTRERRSTCGTERRAVVLRRFFSF